MVSQSTQKPTAWRIERFSKTSGKREFDQTIYVMPLPDLIENMRRTWRVVVTELFAGPLVVATIDSALAAQGAA